MIVQTTFTPLPSVASEPRANTPETDKSAATPPEQAAAPPVALSRKEIDAAVENANRVSSLSDHNLQFSVDDKTDRVVIKVVDQETGKTVREIPPEEVLAIAESLERYQKGLLLSQKA